MGRRFVFEFHLAKCLFSISISVGLPSKRLEFQSHLSRNYTSLTYSIHWEVHHMEMIYLPFYCLINTKQLWGEDRAKMSSLSRSNIGAQRGRSAKTHMLMHSHRYTSHTSQNLRRSSYCVFLPVSMTLPTHSALHLTINQQTNHTKDQATRIDSWTHTHSYTHMHPCPLSLLKLCVTLVCSTAICQ